MDTNEKDEGIVADVEEINEEVKEGAEEKAESSKETAKPKRTPQEEYDYHLGRAQRLAKKHGFGEKNDAPVEREKVSHSDKSGELDYGEKAYLRSALNLKGADELQLASDWKNKYGSRVDEMENDEVFLAKLNNLREARASAAAIPKGTKRTGEGGVTDVDLAVAKYRETGELPSEWELRNKVIDKAIIEPSKGNNALFSGK